MRTSFWKPEYRALVILISLTSICACAAGKKKAGEPCSADVDCESGHCYNSVCQSLIQTGTDASGDTVGDAAVDVTSAGPEVASTGPADGTWRLDTKVCNGTAVDISSTETHFILKGTSGTIVNQYCTITVTISYPAASRIDWVLGQVDCMGSTQGSGDHHSAAYVISGGTLTLTEEMTPADEFGCPSGTQVSTLTLL